MQNNWNRILIVGNINVHVYVWNLSGLKNEIGEYIINFTDTNEFIVANDSITTYYTYID